MQKKLKEDQIQEIIKLYQSGMTPKDIGKKFGLYNNSITRILRKRNIERNQLVRTSQNNINAIIEKYTAGFSSEKIGEELNINPTTVRRILKRNNIEIGYNKMKDTTTISLLNNYGTTYIPTWNNIVLKGKNLKTISSEDKLLIADELVKFYHQNGFPYPKLTDDEIIKEFNSLKQADYNKIVDGSVIKLSNNVGMSIFKHFSPQFYETNGSSKKLSMLETFKNPTLLKKVIINRLEGNYNMTGNMLKQGLPNSKVAYKASMFNPLLARYIYSTYTKENDIVYDYSMGFGQRLTAALAVKHPLTYVGVDPYQKSFNSNVHIRDFITNKVPGNNRTADLYCLGSEQFNESKYHNKIKLAFSSPPYYNLEQYEQNDKQAYFNGYDYFINNWWKATVNNISDLLTDDGIFAINIKEVVSGFNMAEDMINIIKEKGFKLFKIYQMQLTKNLAFNNKNKTHKYEPIYMFTR